VLESAAVGVPDLLARLRAEFEVRGAASSEGPTPSAGTPVYAASPRILQPGGRWGSFTAAGMQRLGTMLRGARSGSASGGGGGGSASSGGGGGGGGGGGVPRAGEGGGSRSGGGSFPGLGALRRGSGSGSGGGGARGTPFAPRSLSALPRLSVELGPALRAAGAVPLDESDEPLEVEGAGGRV
jgi:hypothetical protein